MTVDSGAVDHILAANKDEVDKTFLTECCHKLVLFLLDNQKIQKMDNGSIAAILASQYKASLGMLRQTVERIPEELWNNKDDKNPNWQIAYHVLWGVKFYLGPTAESYVPFETAIEGGESLGGSQEWENPEEGITVEGFHTKEELLSFIEQLKDELPSAIDGLPFDEPSGFEWYPYSRLELHINSIRHIQHHTAQLIERLKAEGITGFPWWVMSIRGRGGEDKVES